MHRAEVPFDARGFCLLNLVTALCSATRDAFAHIGQHGLEEHAKSLANKYRKF